MPSVPSLSASVLGVPVPGASVDGAPSARESALLAEVQALARTIANARAEIQKLAVDDIGGNHIPTATDELDAIVEHTAAATDTILEACETVDAAGAALGGEVGGEWPCKLQAATTRIYEACSFQDITGQRIRKVVGALKAIDAKVAAMLDQFGPHMDLSSAPAAGNSPARDAREGHEALLNGPQLPKAAMDQSSIDKLLASFG